MPRSGQARNSHPPRIQETDYLKQLLVAGARASSLGIAVMDSQTRFETVNASLAREMRIDPYAHIGKTTCELVGGVGLPMEPVHERVLRLGKAEGLLVGGRVRDTPETGYWLNHCFPITDSSRRVQQLGLFVVNVTTEKTSSQIFQALATDSKRMMADAAGLLNKFDEAVKHYHRSLRESFEQLGCPFTATPRRIERFNSSVMRLDKEISTMRNLIYEVMAHFSIPEC
jgi:hypothetical protein